MKWVKCIYNRDPHALAYFNITVGKVYKVLYNDGELNETIIIIDDYGGKSYWSMQGNNGEIWFKDGTAEVRNNNINKILYEVG